MRQIELQFNAKNNRKPFKTSFAENWNELSPKQLLQAVKFLYTIPQKNLLHIQLLRVLLQLPRRASVFLFEPWQLSELLPVTEFLRETNTLTKQLLPVIRLPFFKGWQKFIGPKERFRNILFLEFIFADTYYLHWCQTKNEDFLHKMLATLYRPKKWLHFFKCRLASYNGDARQPFNEHLVAARAEKMKHLPFETKMAIATWYRGCRNLLEKDYPHVFNPENQEKAKGKGGWEPVLRNMAGGKFGDLERTAQQNIHVILMQMEELIEMAEDQKARQNQQY